MVRKQEECEAPVLLFIKSSWKIRAVDVDWSRSRRKRNAGARGATTLEGEKLALLAICCPAGPLLRYDAKTFASRVDDMGWVTWMHSVPKVLKNPQTDVFVNWLSLSETNSDFRTTLFLVYVSSIYTSTLYISLSTHWNRADGSTGLSFASVSENIFSLT